MGNKKKLPVFQNHNKIKLAFKSTFHEFFEAPCKFFQSVGFFLTLLFVCFAVPKHVSLLSFYFINFIRLPVELYPEILYSDECPEISSVFSSNVPLQKDEQSWKSFC